MTEFLISELLAARPKAAEKQCVRVGVLIAADKTRFTRLEAISSRRKPFVTVGRFVNRSSRSFVLSDGQIIRLEHDPLIFSRRDLRDRALKIHLREKKTDCSSKNVEYRLSLPPRRR